MIAASRTLCLPVVICILAAVAFAQDDPVEPIVANQNRSAAGKLENGVLTLHLELRSGAWHAEAEDGPQLFVQAFGEAGRVAQIPGPLIRVPNGTMVHVTVANKLDKKATVFGLNVRPGDLKIGIDLAPGETHELSFEAGAPGTYYYWARTTTDKRPLYADAQLNGAYIVDPSGPVVPDRVFVLNAMLAPADVLHGDFEVVSINGKSYPYTEPLEYTEGEKVRWRVINASFGLHPMHLHGAFYELLSLGDAELDTAFAEGERQWVVTQPLRGASTMMMEWKPEHAGSWLFHFHFQAHISSSERVPMLTVASRPEPVKVASASHGHTSMAAMNDMAGLVLLVNVKAATNSAPLPPGSAAPRKLDLVIEPTAASGKSPTFSCSVREGKKVVASEDKSMGPAIVVTRGEPTEITVLNHLDKPTAIHWHGLELDSYYDGVIGGGTANQVTPAIAPGGNFTARFTPNRAGTFIYHTHAADPDQLSGGVYGALIVIDPGERFDYEHDKLLVLGSRETSFYAKQLTLNGAEDAVPLRLQRGAKYRFRLINMGSNLAAEVQLGSKEHLATWRAIAKDGAVLPSRLARTGDASFRISSGETYDFEFQPETAGEIQLQVVNLLNGAKLVGKIVVQ